MKHEQYNRAFTIVELIVVITVIAVLATISTVAYQGINIRAKNTAIITALSSAVKILEIQKVSTGDYRGDVGGVPKPTPGTSYSLSYPLNKTSDSSAIISKVVAGGPGYKLSSSSGSYFSNSSYATSSVNHTASLSLNSKISSIYTTTTYITDDHGIANYAAQLKYILVDSGYPSPASTAGNFVVENDSVLPQKRSYAVITALFYGRQSCPDINGKSRLQTKPSFSNYAGYYPIKSSANFTACHYLLGEI